MVCRGVAVIAGIALSRLLCAADVVMGFPEAIPPYVLPEGGGVEVDIAREALAYRGHELIPSYFPIDKLSLAFRFNRVDAVMVNDGAGLSQRGGYVADASVAYNDVMVHLESKGIELNRPDDLTGLLVVGFSGAQAYYPEWVKVPQADGLYFEWASQEQQALGIYRGNFDVMISDRFIFCYYTNNLVRFGKIEPQLITMDRLSDEPVFHRGVFKDESIRDDFNAGISYLKASGRYQQIYDAYLKSDDSDALLFDRDCLP